MSDATTQRATPTDGENATVTKVRSMVAPLLADLKLDLYDIEFRGGTLRITIDTPVGSPGGVDLEQIAFVTRMVSRDLDHDDPVPGRYTLEVSSPGLERTLRTPAHFQREIGKTVAIRLRDIPGEDRRFNGELIAATDHDITVRLDDAALTERVVRLDQIDRAKTVFVWGAAPKPGQGGSKKRKPPSTRAAAVAAALGKGPSDEMDPPADLQPSADVHTSTDPGSRVRSADHESQEAR